MPHAGTRVNPLPAVSLVGGTDSNLYITQGKTLTPEPMYDGRRHPNFKGLFATASRTSLPFRDRLLMLPRWTCVAHSLLCTPWMSSAHGSPGIPTSSPCWMCPRPCALPSRVLEAGLPSPQNFWLQAHLPSFVAPPVELMVRTTRLQLIQDIVLSPCEAVLETCGDSAGASHLTSQHSQVARY